VPGKKRAALARTIGDFFCSEPEYLNPPSYAYRIESLILDRDGCLHGEPPLSLLTTLEERGFIPAE